MGLEESEGSGLLVFAEYVEGEGFGLLDEGVGTGVGLDADDKEGWLEGGLGGPVDSGGDDGVVRAAAVRM